MNSLAEKNGLITDQRTYWIMSNNSASKYHVKGFLPILILLIVSCSSRSVRVNNWETNLRRNLSEDSLPVLFDTIVSDKGMIIFPFEGEEYTSIWELEQKEWMSNEYDESEILHHQVDYRNVFIGAHIISGIREESLKVKGAPHEWKTTKAINYYIENDSLYYLEIILSPEFIKTIRKDFDKNLEKQCVENKFTLLVSLSRNKIIATSSYGDKLCESSLEFEFNKELVSFKRKPVL